MKHLLFLLLSSISLSALAVDWIKIKTLPDGSENFIADGSFIYDNITKEASVWEKTNSTKFTNYEGQKLSRISNVVYHCKLNKYKIMYSALLSRDKVISYYLDPIKPIISDLDVNKNIFYKASCTKPLAGIYLD